MLPKVHHCHPWRALGGLSCYFGRRPTRDPPQRMSLRLARGPGLCVRMDHDVRSCGSRVAAQLCAIFTVSIRVLTYKPRFGD